jgi:hypothetical protein
VVDDRLVHLVAADAHRLGDDDPTEEMTATSLVPPPMSDDHVPGRLGDRQAAPIAAAIGSSIR